MRIDQSQPPQLVNQSFIVYSQGSGTRRTYSNAVGIPIESPQLHMEKSASANYIIPGRPIRYQVRINNLGALPADIVLHDETDDGMTFVPNSIQRNGIPVTGAQLAPGYSFALNAGEETDISYQLMLTVTAECPAMISNVIRADYTCYTTAGRRIQGNVYSNTLSLPVTSNKGAEIYARLSVSKHKAVPGDLLRYSLLVGNEGDAPAECVLRSLIPSGTAYVPNSLLIDGQWSSEGASVLGLVHLGAVPSGSRVNVSWEVTLLGASMIAPGQIITKAVEILVQTTESSCGKGQARQIATNSVRVEVFIPIIQAKLKVCPEITFPDGKVQFEIVVRNTGNILAQICTGRLVSNPLLLVEGSLRIQGQPAGNGFDGECYQLGELLPGGDLRIQFQALVSPFVTSNTISGHILFKYVYRLNQCEYTGEVSTNPYCIAIEYEDE